MSRRLWRCRCRTCPAPHGAVLGHLTATRDLVLDPAVATFRVYLDTRRAVVACPRCSTPREFRGGSVFSTNTSGGSTEAFPAKPASSVRARGAKLASGNEAAGGEAQPR